MTEAFPLAWAAGWARTPSHKRQDSKNRFKRTGRWDASRSPYWTFAEARDGLFEEIGRLGGKSIVLSTNFPTDRYGIPIEKGRRPDDNGVAIYFQFRGKAMVMACDMHTRAEENMRSLTLAIEAMRQLDRHGGGTMMERAFEGFAALPAPGTTSWWQIMQIGSDATIEQIEAAFRRLARERHPDAGGSHDMMSELNRARDQAMKDRAA